MQSFVLHASISAIVDWNQKIIFLTINEKQAHTFEEIKQNQSQRQYGQNTEHDSKKLLQFRWISFFFQKQNEFKSIMKIVNIRMSYFAIIIRILRNGARDIRMRWIRWNIHMNFGFIFWCSCPKCCHFFARKHFDEINTKLFCFWWFKFT